MASAVNVGSASVTIMPSMNGFAASFDAAFSGAGSGAGASFSKGLSGSISGVGAKISAEGERGGSGLASGLSKASGPVGGLSSKMAALTGAVGGFAATAVSGVVGAVSGLVGEMVEASDSADKFASTLQFAGLDTSTIEALTASTQEYADATVYDISDIRNVTAQLASNGVENYAQLAEAAGNLNAVAGGNKDTFKSVGMVMTQTAGTGKLTTENFNQLSDAIAGASGPLQQALSDMGAFEGGVGNFRQAMEDGEISADEFFAAVQQLGMTDVAQEAAKSTSTIEGAMGNLQASVVGVGEKAITAIKPAITGAMTGLADGISQIPALFERVLPALQPLGDALMGAFSAAQPYIQSALSSLTSVGTQIISFVAPAVGQIVQKVASELPQVASIVSNVLGAVQGVVTTVLPVIKGVWDAVWPPLSYVVSTVFSIISEVVSSVMGVVQAVISTVSAAIAGDWDGVWSGIQSVFSAVWDAILTVVSGVLSAMTAAVDGALAAIKGIWEGAWSAVSSLLSGAWESMKSVVSGGVDAVIGFISGLPGQIMGFFSDCGSWLVNAGASIINGLLDGIKGAFQGVADFVGGIGSWIVEHKGPPSYDRVMLVENGELIMRGLARGMSGGFDRYVLGAIASASSEMASWQPSVAAAGVGAVRAASSYRAGGSRQLGDTYVIRIDGARINDEQGIRDAARSLVYEARYGRGAM